MHIPTAVRRIYPQARELIDFAAQDDGDGPRIVKWALDDPQPTRQQLVDAWAAHVAELAATDYQVKRRREYPPIEDQVAALIEGGQALAAVKAAIAAVKAKYPKPQ